MRRISVAANVDVRRRGNRERRSTMYIVVRTWTNAGALADAMQQREQEVTDIIGGVPGFVAYYATRAGDTLTTVTVCLDQAGTQESTRRVGRVGQSERDRGRHRCAADCRRGNLRPVLIGSLARAKLQTDGYAMVTAGRGAEALELLEDQRPDLIMLDLMMPGMDGFETLRRIRE